MRLNGGVLLMICLAGLLFRCHGAQEDTPVNQLAWHDGMLFFNGAIRKSIPPNATVAGLDVAAQAVPCACSDGDPRSESSLLVDVDCFYQAYFDNCNASFMSSFLQELLGLDGFCQTSCGRCTCCTNPADVLTKLNATRFLQALEAAQPSLLDLFRHPGYMTTILGISYRTPLCSSRSSSSTYFRQSQCDVTAYGGLTGFQITGPINSATVLKSDIMSCKSYLNVIDTVLLPFDPAPLANGGGVASALGVPPQCSVQANGMINGSTTVLDGNANRQYGYCQLLHSPEVAEGQPPSYGDFGPVTVPLVAGYISSAPPVAAAGRRLLEGQAAEG
ncbi:hypothetical protein N2152v2_004713 [Parachlorella kessleri]